MKPIKDLILIKPCPSDEMTESGLIIPESARERSSKATVVSVGRGTKHYPVDAKVGDTVIHVKGAGSEKEFIIDGEPHFLIRQIDILSYVTNN